MKSLAMSGCALHGRLVVALLAFAACDESGTKPGDGDRPSGATCPPENTLTYETFGEAFMDDYCVRCHSSSLTGDLRLDAPDDANFDTLAGVRQHLAHLDTEAAAGPFATNTAMPEGDPRPTLEERTKLGQWIACGAP